MMLFGGDIILGSFMISITVVLHTVGMALVIKVLSRWMPKRDDIGILFVIAILLFVILSVFFLHTIEIWSWALAYLALGQFSELETALYFSTVTFTNLGYGDIVLSEQWRLLSGFEAVNGVILFGVSTAFVFAVITKLYENSLGKSR